MADPTAVLDEDNETAETATCGGGGGATGFPPHCTIDSMTRIDTSTDAQAANAERCVSGIRPHFMGFIAISVMMRKCATATLDRIRH
jgi:hypothetical protein